MSSVTYEDVVPGSEHRNVLRNFQIAHEKVQQQRQQLEEQERQIGQLRARIATLEGGAEPQKKQISNQGGSSVDDFTIRNAAARLERLINRWAADIVRRPPATMNELRYAAFWDIYDGDDVPEMPFDATPIHVQNLLRHAMVEAIAIGIINVLVVTDSSEANIQLTRIHEQIFARDPLVASVWRRQTFSAAVERPSRDAEQAILDEHIPAIARIMGSNDQSANSLLNQILVSAHDFSRMLHGNASGSDAFYRSFVPELAVVLDPAQVELLKRCMRTEAGDVCRLGATVFPGLVKVTRKPPGPSGKSGGIQETIVKRAQAMCECALAGAPGPQPGMAQPGIQQPGIQQPGIQQHGMPQQLGIQQPGMPQPGGFTQYGMPQSASPNGAM